MTDAHTDLSAEDIQEILRIFTSSELEELRIEIGTTRLYLSKQAGRAPFEEGSSAPRPAVTAEPPDEAEPSLGSPEPAAGSPEPQSATPRLGRADDLFELVSPLLGVFYRRPAPDQAPFVEVGSEVSADDAVCIVDVMKMFTRIPAGIDGRVVEICAEEGKLVEHGQVLMRIAPR